MYSWIMFTSVLLGNFVTVFIRKVLRSIVSWFDFDVRVILTVKWAAERSFTFCYTRQLEEHLRKFVFKSLIKFDNYLVRFLSFIY